MTPVAKTLAGISSLEGYVPNRRNNIVAASNCPECNVPIRISFDPHIAAVFPALMGLDQMVICNDCAAFRTALREAQEVMESVIAVLRKRGQSVTAKTRLRATVQPDIDALTAEFRPLVESASNRIIRCLARRSRRPEIDPMGWSTQFLAIWEISKTYSGEELIRVQSDDQTWVKFKTLRNQYGIRLVHHGKARNAPPSSAAPVQPIRSAVVEPVEPPDFPEPSESLPEP